MLNIYKKVLALYKPLHGVMWFVLFLMVVTNLLDLVWPYIYGKTINLVIGGADFATIAQILGIALGVLVIQNLVGYCQAVFELKNFDYASIALAQKVTLKKLFSFSIGQHRNEHSGLTQSVVSDGQNSLRDLVNLSIYSILPNMLRVVFALTALFILSWKIGVIVLVGFSVIMLIIYFQNKYFTPFVRKEREMGQELGKKRSEMIRNAPLVISSTGEAYAEALLDSETEEKDSYGKSYWEKYNRITFFLRGMIGDITLIAAIGASAYFLSKGELGAGQIVTVILWTSAVLSNIGYLANMQRQILFASEKLRKYFKVLELTSDVQLPQNPVRPERIEGEIEFRNVSFLYPEKRIIEDEKDATQAKKDEGEKKNEALNDVSFKITPGEHVAFVGASGAGKSTTILLLLRGSDPQTGSVHIDGINLTEIDLEYYRSSLGLVEQNIVLFDDTIRRNISFGVRDGRQLTDEEMDRLAKIARIDEFKDKLVNGWDTVIGENGIKLSGGQRQRVGIARALAKDPAILVLDEATSSLDAKNEALIKDALHEASKGRTTIMIAHRLSTVRDADRIFVFDKGTIVGIGTHEELMKTCAKYADLVSHQTVLM